MKETKTYYRIDEEEQNLIKEIENITITDYEIFGEFIPNESLLNIIKDLMYEYHKLEEKIQELNDNENPYEYDNYRDRELEENYE